MTFRDPELKELFQRYSEGSHESDGELRPIFALMALFDRFYFIEGEQSSKVQEVMSLLCSEEVRPALRKWYRNSGDNLNPGALRLREQLSTLVGEPLAC